MNKLRILLVLLFVGCISINSIAQDEILMSIGDKDVSLGEFERIYNKNNNNIVSEKQTPEEYMELFVNFKLKVLEAEKLGMDTTKKFLKEFNGYKEQLAKPYLTDEASKKQMMAEAYERMKYDVHVSHILLSMNSSASPEDTLQRYNQAMEIRKRILNGEAFDVVAKATSDDPSAKTNGGDLGYFTVFMMMYSFESAAYNTPVGDVSMPVRTSYGYHILKIHDKRDAVGQVKAAHIFLRTPEGMPEEELEKIKEKALLIQDSISMGVEFGQLAKKHSDDRNSAVNNGELPLFGTGRMIKEFETRVFGLKNPGDVTEAFKTFYGWHIVKLIEKLPIGTYSEMESTLQSKAFKGDREREKNGRYIEKLKESYAYDLNESNYMNAYQLIDTSFLAGNFKAAENVSEYNNVLFSVADSTVYMRDFIAYMENNQKKGNRTPLPILIDMGFEKFSENYIMAVEKASLPYRFPEFKYILQEYHDGILLFDLMDQKVWSNAVKDSTGLEKFFKKHRDDYMWGDRMGAMVVTCDSAVDVNAVRKTAGKIASGRYSKAKLNKKFAKNIDNGISLEKTIAEPGKNKHIDALNMKPGTGELYYENGRAAFVITTGIVPPTRKDLSECRGLVTSDYQDYLEKEWIRELKNKYKVVINNELLSKIEN